MMKLLFALVALSLSSPAFAIATNKYGSGPMSNLAFYCYAEGGNGTGYDIITDSYTTTGYGKWSGDIRQVSVVNQKTGERSDMNLVYSHGRLDQSLGTYRTDPRGSQQLILDINGRGERGDVHLEDVKTHQVYQCFSAGDCC